MADAELEKRVEALERKVAELGSGRANGAARPDWRSTVGMFTGDEIMKQIDEAARKIREADRRRARRPRTSKARAHK